MVDRKVLLVNNYQKDTYDFWVLPGGGIEENEGIFRAAEREIREETNLHVKAERIAYIEEFMDGGKYVCKFWVYCELISGNLSIKNKVATEDYLRGTGFFSEDDLIGLQAFPAVLKTSFWQDLDNSFAEIKYLGYGPLDNDYKY